MAAKTNAQLTTQAQQIATESVAGSNTVARVGAMAQDLNDSKINIDAISTNIASDTGSVVKVPAVAAVETLAATKENTSNKSTDVTADGASNTKYPAVKAVKDYADTKVGLTNNETISGSKTYSVPQTFSSNLFANGPVNLSSDTYIQQNVSLAASGVNYGAVGQVFTSQGAGACPIWTNGVITTKVSLTSAEILALFTTPKTLVATPGAGKVLVPISLTYRYTFVTAAYATNVNLRLRNGISLAQNAALINLTGNAYSFQPISGGIANVDVSNTALTLDVQTGNPTGGSGTLDVYLTYTIVTL